MTQKPRPPFVGSPDPTLKNSPILEESSEEFEVLEQEVDELPVCYFNGVTYEDGEFVCSGSGELLKCSKGVWIQEGGCDPDNP
jgi:hypothetical protein